MIQACHNVQYYESRGPNFINKKNTNPYWQMRILICWYVQHDDIFYLMGDECWIDHHRDYKIRWLQMLTH